MTYIEFFNGLAKGTKYETGVSFKRLNPLPIDPDSCFESEDSLNSYISSSGIAYPTQIVCVKGNSGLSYYYLDLDENGALVKKPFGSSGEKINLVSLSSSDIQNNGVEFSVTRPLESNTYYSYLGPNSESDVKLNLTGFTSGISLNNVVFLQPGSFYIENAWTTNGGADSIDGTFFYNCEFQLLLNKGFKSASFYNSKIVLKAKENGLLDGGITISAIKSDIEILNSSAQSTSGITISKANKSRLFIKNEHETPLAVNFGSETHECDVYISGNVELSLSNVNTDSDIRVHNLNHIDGAFLLQIGGDTNISEVQEKIDWETNTAGGLKAEVAYSVYNYGKTAPNAIQLPKIRTFTLVGEAANNTYEETYDSPEVEVLTGKITFYSNSEAQMLVLIY